MKIRSNFVSNSSSSSFIIAGKNILETLKKFINDTNMVNYEPEWYRKDPDFTYGNVVKEILRQCKNSTEDAVKGVIAGLVYQAVDFYITESVYKILPNQRCVCFMNEVPEDKWYEKYVKGTEFDLPKEFKNKIKEAIKEQYNKTGSTSKWEYCYFNLKDNIPDFEKMKNEIINSNYKNYIDKYGELYAVSFGDNHGECSGRMGAFVECDFLGNRSMNSYMKTDFQIYRNDEH